MFQDPFLPLSVRSLVRAAAKKPIRSRVLGEGKVFSDKKGDPPRDFVILRLPVGENSLSRFPVWVPEGVRFLNTVTITADQERGATLVMKFDKPEAGTINILSVESPPPRRMVLCHDSIEYRLSDGKWALARIDEQVF